MTWPPGQGEREPRVFALGPRTRLALWPEEGIEPTGRLQGVIVMEGSGGRESAAARVECGTDQVPALNRISAAEADRNPCLRLPPNRYFPWFAACLIVGALAAAILATGLAELLNDGDDAPAAPAATVMQAPPENGTAPRTAWMPSETGTSYLRVLNRAGDADAPHGNEAPIQVSCLPPEPAPALMPVLEPLPQDSSPAGEPEPPVSGTPPQAPVSRSGPAPLLSAEPAPAVEARPHSHSATAAGAGDPSLPAEEWLRLRLAEEFERASDAAPAHR